MSLLAIGTRPAPRAPEGQAAVDRHPQPPGAAPLVPPAGVPTRAPFHPGRFLQRHYLEPLGMSQTEAARHLGISRRRVNELVMGHRSMSADTAIRCAMAFGLPASEWLGLQAQWDSFQTWKDLHRQIRGPQQAPAAAPDRASAPTVRT